MALTAPLVRILRELQPLLHRGGSLLEIGEANWYGDIDPAEAGDIAGLDRKAPSFGFDVCKVFYRTLFGPERMAAIDINGTLAALRVDLNDGAASAEAVRDGDYDVVINNGTAEHVFNIAQVFRTVHDACELGGMMIHDAPMTGWLDHGLYTLQPGLFYDLATANNYEVVRVYVTEIKSNTVIRVESRDHIAVLSSEGKIPANAMLVVVLRKLGERPFKLPMQGYYARTLSDAGIKAWQKIAR